MEVFLPEEVIFLWGEAGEKHDFWGETKLHIPLQQGPYIVYYTELQTQQNIV